MRVKGFVAELESRPTWRWTGRVVQANAQTVESDGPPCSVGECCEIQGAGGERFAAEVIGFRGRRVLAMPLDTTTGVQYGDGLRATGRRPSLGIGNEMLGRVLDATGVPLDGRPKPLVDAVWPLEGMMQLPMEREPITEPLGTGVRMVDGLLTVGRGQRVGIFGGSGVGKSTLIGMMTRGTAADLTVVGLVGERGREVREFVEDALGAEGLARSVVIVSTSDQSALLRMRAAQAATTIAEFHARKGKHVLLVLDSLTRYAMAARELGLAAGEPPASKGYTPSVFSKLAKLVERAGNLSAAHREGSITAFYTVLMEGDDEQDPIVDAVRSFLDGHIVLSRSLAGAGQYPPIDLLHSLSRLMPAVAEPRHREKAALVRGLLATYASQEDLIRIGAYQRGADAELDRAVERMPLLRSYMQQGALERVSFTDAVDRLHGLKL